MRKVFLFDAGEAFLNRFFVGSGLCLPAQVLDGTGKESAGTTGRVEDPLALVEIGIDLFDDEPGHRARGVEFAGVTGRLEIFKDFLVDVAKHVAIIRSVEIDAVDLIDYLAHEGAVLHVVVGLFEGHANQAGDSVSAARQALHLG